MNYKILWFFVRMPTLVQNAAKSEKWAPKSDAKYSAIHILFFAFPDRFREFGEKYIADRRVHVCSCFLRYLYENIGSQY